MSRIYRWSSVKKNRVYLVEDLTKRFNVTANTVSNWVGEGLMPSDNYRPFVFQGAAIQAFHKQRALRTLRNLRPGEFKCLRCKAAVFPEITTVQDNPWSAVKHMYGATCPICDASIFKLSNATDRDIVEDCRNPNTSRQRLHEENDQAPVGIGISEGPLVPTLHLANDRIIHKWQVYAGRFDEKTVDAHLSAIRYFESLTKGKRFDCLTVDDVSRVRDDLKRRVHKDADDSLSTSTVKHRASHLISFFKWLQKQPGYSKFPKDLPDYMHLPKAALAAAPPRAPKPFPTIEEASTMLCNMPAISLVDRRARAIFAIAFLAALRADTVISLRIKHIDVAGRKVIQDGTSLRSKNGKSENIFWFPIPDLFLGEVTGWIDIMGRRGFRENDALFPSMDWVLGERVRAKAGNQAVPVMTTKHAVTEAFAVASRGASRNYTPHSAKHTIGALRDDMRLTHAQRRAWSENMGHENERITDTHYARLSDPQRAEVLDSIADDQDTLEPNISDAEKIALFDSILRTVKQR